MEKLTTKEEFAIKKAFKNCGILAIDEIRIDNYMEDGTATINKARNGRDVAWVIWSENNQSAVYIDTLEALSEQEIENELC